MMNLVVYVLAASLFCLATAQAASFNVTTTIGTPLNSTEPGLVVLADDLDPAKGAFTSRFVSFDLSNIGDSFKFDAFVVHSTEAAVDADDLAEKPFSVLFDFAGIGMAELFGSTSAVIYAGVSGIREGLLRYLPDSPTFIDVGGGKTVRVSGVSGYFGAASGVMLTGRYNGTYASYVFDLVQTPAPVPLPATLPLALGAFGLLAAASRRSKAHTV
jgi:hypothetical protein